MRLYQSCPSPSLCTVTVIACAVTIDSILEKNAGDCCRSTNVLVIGTGTPLPHSGTTGPGLL